jgi:hypothetical protein
MLASLIKILIPIVSAANGNWNVPVTLQYRVFPNVPQYTGQTYNNGSLSLKPKYQKDNLLFEPFYRLDENDPNRTHFDIRELSYSQKLKDGRLSYGIKKVFWGVTETQHLVDIINQSDFAENGDYNEKLGQPMVHYFYPTKYGKWDMYLLAGFREQTFPGTRGRLRTSAPVNTVYTERIRKADVDFATRWSERFDRFDLGVSAFYGNARAPVLRPDLFPPATPNYYIATYDEITQVGIDAQYTLDKIIWKGEFVWRDGKGSTITDLVAKNFNKFTACTVGGEYIFGSVRGTDLAFLLEYSNDSRPRSLTAFQNDIFTGVRWTLNDAYESNLFVGALSDASTRASTLSLRYNRRIYENLTLNVRSLTFSNVPDPQTDPYEILQNDSYFEINLTQYFLF